MNLSFGYMTLTVIVIQRTLISGYGHLHKHHGANILTAFIIQCNVNVQCCLAQERWKGSPADFGIRFHARESPPLSQAPHEQQCSQDNTHLELRIGKMQTESLMKMSFYVFVMSMR